MYLDSFDTSISSVYLLVVHFVNLSYIFENIDLPITWQRSMEINGIRISMDLVENMKLKESLNA